MGFPRSHRRLSRSLLPRRLLWEILNEDVFHLIQNPLYPEHRTPYAELLSEHWDVLLTPEAEERGTEPKRGGGGASTMLRTSAVAASSSESQRML